MAKWQRRKIISKAKTEKRNRNGEVKASKAWRKHGEKRISEIEAKAAAAWHGMAKRNEKK
jgi:hypothetical protein